jgi:hypothetical protein
LFNTKGVTLRKNLLRSFGFIGLLLFLPLFLFTFSDPQLIEKSGKSFIAWKLQNEVNKKIDLVQIPKSKTLESLFGNKIKKLHQKSTQKLEKLKEQLRKDAPKMVMDQIAKTSNLSCECRKKWEDKLRSSLIFDISSLEKAKKKLANFAQAKYMDIVEKLTLDIRIFLGANSFIFLILVLASFVKPKATEHLFLPGVLMLVSTIICSCFYLFEQNWFYTVVYSNYTGFGYVAYLTVVFSILCDIVFNKARVTTRIINLILNIIGSALSVASC